MELFILSSYIYYVLTSSFIAILMLCILVRKCSEPYPNTFRTKKEKQYFDPTKNKFEEFPSIRENCTLHLSVIVPAYDEENRLPSMLDECIQYLEACCKADKNYNYEIIIVNDGSKDNTSKVALKYIQRFGTDKIRLLELETNRGKGGAVYMGVQSARGAVILFADADGATKFEELAKLEAAMLLLVKDNYKERSKEVSERKAIICGSRAHLEKEASAKRSLFRIILMHCFHFLVWLFAVRSIRDTQCGFKLLTRKAAKLCFHSLHIKRWAFDVELLYIAEKFNIPLAEVAVQWTEIEGSKLIPFWSWLQMGKDLFFMWFRYTTGAWKLSEYKE